MSTEQAQATTTPAETSPPAPITMTEVDKLLDADQASEHEVPAEEAEQRQEATTTEVEQKAATTTTEEEGTGDLRVPLREERERRRLAEQFIQEQARHQRELAGAFAEVTKKLLPQTEQTAPKGPDWETDPAGFLKHSIDQLNTAFTNVQKAQAENQQRTEQVEAFNAATRAVGDLEQGFVAKQPDYYEAVNFVRDRLRSRFEVLGVPKEQLDLAVKADLQRFGLQSLRAGVNPAERLFALAKVEGYTGTKEAAAARLDTIAKGQQSTKGARSSAPANEGGTMSMEQARKLSIKDLQKMSDEEFQRIAEGG